MLCSGAYVVVGRHKMSVIDSGKASWKDLGLEKMFIDLCSDEANTRGKKESSLNFKSWDITKAALNNRRA